MTSNLLQFKTQFTAYVIHSGELVNSEEWGIAVIKDRRNNKTIALVWNGADNYTFDLRHKEIFYRETPNDLTRHVQDTMQEVLFVTRQRLDDINNRQDAAGRKQRDKLCRYTLIEIVYP